MNVLIDQDEHIRLDDVFSATYSTRSPSSSLELQDGTEVQIVNTVGWCSSSYDVTPEDNICSWATICWMVSASALTPALHDITRCQNGSHCLQTASLVSDKRHS